MVGRMAGGLMVGASLLVCVFSATEQKETQSPEAARLIDSIQGPALFTTYCAVCHGEGGKVDGPMAKSLKTQPPDLTRLAARNGGKFPMDRVQKIIGSKEQVPAGHGTRQMPVWGPIFFNMSGGSSGQVLQRVSNLNKYIESLQAK